MPNTAARDRETIFSRGFLAALPAIAIVAICCAMPLAWIVTILLTNPEVRADLHLSSFRFDLLMRTLRYNFLAALIATAMGFPAGLVLGRGRGFFARSLWFVMPTALFMPSLAFAYGWSQVVRLADPIYHPLGLQLTPGTTPDIFRCIWTLAAWLWAVPACLIGLSLRRMDTSVQLHAALEGALLRVMLRQLAAPIIVSIAAVTILATQEFSVYEPTGISVVATEVRMVFDSGAFSSLKNPITGSIAVGGVKSPDQQRRAASAVATATPLLLITIALAAASAWAANRFAAADELAIGSWPRVLDAPRWASILSVIFLTLNIAVPIVALFHSLTATLSVSRIYEEFAPPVWGSILLGAIVAAIAAVAALSASTRWTRGLLVIAGLSFLVGGQILAIALIRITNRRGLIWAYDSLAVPVVAYFARFGWLALASARTTWSKPWREIREMAALDGAPPLRVAVHVIWPLAWPALLAGCILVGALSLTEVPATVLIFPQNPQVLTPMLMTWVHTLHFNPMIEASLLMVALVLVPASIAIVLAWFAKKRFRNRTQPPRRA